jgi:tetratricopeptide (TPR) repeat protein
MMKLLRQIRKRPFTVCSCIGAVLFIFYLYPAPILWLRNEVRTWQTGRELQYRADEMNAASRLHAEGELEAAAEKLNALLLREPPVECIWPYSVHIREELALVRRDQGQFEEALRDINWIIATSPDYLHAYVLRIDVAFEMKKWREVLELCEALVDRVNEKHKEKLERSDFEATYLARQYHASAWARLGEFETAESEIRKLIDLASNDRVNYSLLAELFARKKDYRRALQYFQQASELIEPDWNDPEEVDAWNRAANNLAEWLATCPDASVRDGKRAKKIAEDLLTKSDRFPFAKTTLAAAYAELGDFDKAVELQRQAMSAPRMNANSPHMQARLASYQRKQPFRLMRYEEP